ncbi:MAG: hypothetical protein AB7F88_07870 [Pyrinomonadaceae bacterium]
MNSEELELSLRTEFESYLNGFLAGLRQEVSEFHKNFEAEFEKHKAQTDEALNRLVQRFDTGVTFDRAFNESVVEHLRLARDEGATLTAAAIGEAEKLKEASAPPAEFDKLRDAINDISNKASQSEILKSLVDHAAHFAPRGAFFIVKNEQFAGWRTFGDEATVDEETVRAVQFPMSLDTIAAKAIATLGTVAASSGSHSDNDQFLNALDFGSPDRMYAIPLVARGRGVAVLYADYGSEGIALNPEALETLVRVAGLTVELAAAAVQAPATQAAPAPVRETVAEATPEPVYQEPASEVEESFRAATPAEAVDSAADEYQGIQEIEHADVGAGFEESAAVQVDEPAAESSFEREERGFETVTEPQDSPEPVESPDYETTAELVPEETEPVEARYEQIDVERFAEPVVEEAEVVEDVAYFEPAEAEGVTEPAFGDRDPVTEYVPVEAVEEFPEVIEEAVVEPAHEPEPKPAESPNGSAAVFEPVAEVASSQAARTRYRDRNVDLPIEVPEDERRLHNDARRFARLLVSEIKLYNEQKVTDGRNAGDLYDRLREAIDRSRDMYDKRVQQPVADKFDYFHYELVSSLAEGEDVKLGVSYPGSKVPA